MKIIKRVSGLLLAFVLLAGLFILDENDLPLAPALSCGG